MLWSKSLKTTVIEGRHFPVGQQPADVVTLAEDSPIFQDIPEGKQRGFDVDGMPIFEDAPVIPAPTLEEVKLACDLKIDQKASDVRARFVTAGVGQDAVYAKKAQEAHDYATAGYPEVDIDEYPYVKAEWNARKNTDLPAITSQEACDMIITLENLWHSIAANIEEVKVGGKRQVNAQTTIVDAEAQRDIAISVLDLIGAP